MVNKIGGKHHKKMKKTGDESGRPLTELIKEDGQEYAIVNKLLGGCKLNATLLSTNKEILCLIPGKMRKKQWIGNGNTILVSMRDFQTDRCDIIMVYTSDEIHKLVKAGHIKKEVVKTDELECDFEFEHNNIDDFEQPTYDMPCSEEESEEEDIDINNI